MSNRRHVRRAAEKDFGVAKQQRFSSRRHRCADTRITRIQICTISNSSLPTPHSGRFQYRGTSSQRVPGGIPILWLPVFLGINPSADDAHPGSRFDGRCTHFASLLEVGRDSMHSVNARIFAKREWYCSAQFWEARRFAFEVGIDSQKDGPPAKRRTGLGGLASR